MPGEALPADGGTRWQEEEAGRGRGQPLPNRTGLLRRRSSGEAPDTERDGLPRYLGKQARHQGGVTEISGCCPREALDLQWLVHLAPSSQAVFSSTTSEQEHGGLVAGGCPGCEDVSLGPACPAHLQARWLGLLVPGAAGLLVTRRRPLAWLPRLSRVLGHVASVLRPSVGLSEK